MTGLESSYYPEFHNKSMIYEFVEVIYRFVNIAFEMWWI